MTKPAKFFVRRPGLTQNQTDQLQEKLQQDASSKEKYVEIDGPGNITIDPTMMLVLQGTQTSFDQSYFIEQVVHHYSADDGYTMEVTAKNGSPEDAGYGPDSGDSVSSGNNPEEFQSTPGFSPSDYAPQVS